jgi:hypothetical protein
MELKRIINIMPDEKFLDYYIKMSNFFLPNESSYIIYSNNLQLKYVVSEDNNIIIIKNDIDSFSNILKFVSEKSTVIFHGFINSQSHFLEGLPKTVKKVWLFWGYDGYGAVPSSKYFKWDSYILTFPNSIINKLKFMLVFGYNYFLRSHNKKAIELIRKMDYCATWIDKDYQLAKKYNENIKRLYFNYYTKEFLNFEDLKFNNANRKRIFLGNSANHTNNHVQALEYLYKKSYDGEIICPLSYGGEETYINSIINIGKRLFNNQFIPITSFMSLDKYQDLINSCGIVWMNHLRQQAAGNLLVSFCSGKIVVLDSNNPMSETFKKWGLFFYEKEDIFNSQIIDEKILSNNRKIILEKVSIEANRFFFDEIHKLKLS